MADGGGHSPHLADALAVSRWAERMEARSEFPRLVRRLIAQTNDQVIKLGIRAAEGTDYGGYDGEVEAQRGTAFVPEGASVWELGVGGDPKAKANSDYKKRTEDSLGVKKSETTFIFATARRWTDKDEWVKEKQAEGVWKDVRAFDADDIETAFEQAPAVHYWFSELVGQPVDGVRSIEDWWDAFSRVSQPSLTPELVLAGRADQAAELLRLLEDDTRITTIAAAGPDDVLAFVAATLMSAQTPEHDGYLARALIVHDASALRRLDATSDLLILLPYDETMLREAQLVRSHHVIILAPDDAPSDLGVPPVDRDEFAKQLVGLGVDEETSVRLARAARRSVIAFQAESPSHGSPLRAWRTAFESATVRRAWLAGGWQEAKSGDTEVLATLFGNDYAAARAELEPHAAGEDPIFVVVGSNWGLAAVEQAWQFGLAKISPQDLDALESTLQSVLAAVDPGLELPIEERWMASIHGKARIHSSDLRKGLAVTLAAAGAHGEGVQIDARGTLAEWAASMVGQLLRRANEDASADLWATLNDVLPLLAEAAPNAFIKAVQEGVAGNEPVLAKIFIDDSGDVLTVSSPHTGMLWALETLAWSEEHAGLAVGLLASLAELDPGGRLSNRPSRSLADIFRTWMPQTSLSGDRRIAVIDALRRDHPDVAWQLMLGLLPENHAVGHYTAAPKFRTWKPEERVLTYGEIWEQTSSVLHRLVEDAGESASRWVEVVGRLGEISPTDREGVLEKLTELAQADRFSAEDLLLVWNRIDKLLRHHREFPEADWSMQEEHLQQIDTVAALYAPKDPLEANAWLFDDHFPRLGSERLEYHEQEELILKAREAAVQEIHDARGFDGLLQLASSSEYPGTVGFAATPLANPDLDQAIRDLIDDDDPKLASFAYSYFARRGRTDGFEWLASQVAEANGRPLAQARLLQTTDNLPSAWKLASDLGTDVEKSYWNEFSITGRGADFDLVDEAAAELLKFGRPIAALDLLNLYVRKDDNRVKANRVAEVMNAFLNLPEDHTEANRVSAYELSGLLDFLREAGIDDTQLATLEWQLLPALGYDSRSPTLERQIATDPKFFIEILSLIYKPRGADAMEKEVPAHVASNAYRLLDHWRIVPGSTEDGGAIDPKELNEWVDQAREQLAEVDRVAVGEIHIGHVLARAGNGTDGAWPPEVVRDLIERVASTHLEEGIEVQVYNDRGTTSRGIYDGGDQERNLSKRYAEWAKSLRDKWPRTSAMLSAISKSYERDARRNDEDAERNREGMDR